MLTTRIRDFFGRVVAKVKQEPVAAGALAFLLLTAATAGMTARQILTAAPSSGAVNLASATGVEGTSTALLRSDATFGVTGILPEARGGTNTGALTCTATQVLTSDGTSHSCATPPGIGATGSAVPSTAQYQGGKDSSGNLLGVRVCDTSLSVAQVALNGSAQLIAGSASKKVYICGGYIVSSAAVSVNFVESATSGNACATSPSDTTGAAPLSANSGWTLGLSGYAVPFLNTAGNALCIKTSGAATLGGWISYTQQVP